MDLRLNGLGKNDSISNGAEGHSSSNGNHVNDSNGHHHGDDDMEEDLDELGQISPSSRRRSTRASAIKAAEKIKYKDDFLPEGTPGHDEDLKDDMEDGPSNPAPKKRKLEDGRALNQFSHRFGIRLEEGAVYAFSDDSIISSLNEQEVDVLRKNYEKAKAREPTDEQKEERIRLLRQAENDLQLEESKLLMLKRNTANQKVKCNDKAYQPVSAKPTNQPQNLSNKDKGNANAKKSVLNHALSGAQLEEVLKKALKLDRAQLQQLIMAGGQDITALLQKAVQAAQRQQQQQQQQQQMHQQQPQQHQQQSSSSNGPSSSSAAAAASTSAAATASSSNASAMPVNPLTAQTPQQRAVAARQAFRRQADQQLSQVAIPPKAPPHNIDFIPQATTADFCLLLGLDHVVQRLLKDKVVENPVSEKPYECEECKTDFTTVWRAIGSNENDMHLYCDACVKKAQKRKLRADHTANMKKIFNKFNAQEKDFEKQIADGKLEAALAEAAKAQAAQQAASLPNRTATPQPKPQPTLPTPQAPPKPAATQNTTPSSTTSSRNRNNQSQQMNNQFSNMSPAQLQMFANMARANPMAAAIMQTGMQNPQLLAQMMQMQWNPMMMAAAATQQSGYAAAALHQARLAAAAQSQQANTNNMTAMLQAALQQQSAAAANTASSGTSSQHAAALAALQAMAQSNNSASTSATNNHQAAQLAQLQAAGLTPAVMMSMGPALFQKLAQLNGTAKKK
ncbi:unnamed protein product, partial [Mesorhabditis spiculigera]